LACRFLTGIRHADSRERFGVQIPELEFGMQIPELLEQCKFVAAACHAHSNDHKPPKTEAPKVLMLENKF